MVFCESFVNDLKTVNDKKTRIDHGTGNTHKHFWICTTPADDDSLKSCSGNSQDGTENKPKNKQR